MPGDNRQWAPAPGMLIVERPDATYLLPEVPLCLDEHGSEVWDAVSEVGVDEAVRRLSEMYDVDLDEMRAGVSSMVAALAAYGALVPTTDTVS